jgi:hypothetical protein
MRRCVDGLPGSVGASSAGRLGEMAVVIRLGDVEGASKAGTVVDDAVDGVKLGDGYDGNDIAGKFGDVGVGACVEAVIFGDMGVCGNVDRKSCGVKLVGIVGRKLGDVAKESARFDGGVANNGLKFGEVEPVVLVVTSFSKPLGHGVSAPSSIWS